MGQLTPSETRIVFQVQKLLEYPQVLQEWTNWTNFCFLPPSPSLNIVCSNNRISHVPKPASGKFVVSQQKLSESFSIDSFFTVVTMLSNLRVLSMVYLGLWGPLPSKINRSLVLAVNLFNGSVPDLRSLPVLEELNLGYNHLGPGFPSLGNSVVSIILTNNSFEI
ncbi:hypothetical protein FNV43_RR26026 [Rhamnella rubrinervis]|uniref:Uncharacterized protein n=1 Tax=Rhamnella rubrinervis TaxID=2594499 RepID=A0A8K0DP22_9ROSA|nr:hypothetical protein FNV43_RR26026 [Rhamnella rubrinervis]